MERYAPIGDYFLNLTDAELRSFFEDNNISYEKINGPGYITFEENDIDNMFFSSTACMGANNSTHILVNPNFSTFVCKAEGSSVMAA